MRFIVARFWSEWLKMLGFTFGGRYFGAMRSFLTPLCLSVCEESVETVAATAAGEPETSSAGLFAVAASVIYIQTAFIHSLWLYLIVVRCW